MKKEYEEILYMQRPYNGKHPKMAMSARAGQFASFAALAGHEEAIEETATSHEEMEEWQ